MKYFAQFVSFLFHPVLFLLLLPFFVVYRQTFDGQYALKWMIFTAVFIFFGLFIFLIGKWRHIFSDYDLRRRKEREEFYVITGILAFSYLSLAILFKGILFPLTIIALGLFLSIGIFMVVTVFVRASIHVGAAMGFVLSLGLLFGQTVALATIWIPLLVAWSRLTLTKHTFLETITGGALGIAITALTFFAGRSIIMGAL